MNLKNKNKYWWNSQNHRFTHKPIPVGPNSTINHPAICMVGMHWLVWGHAMLDNLCCLYKYLKDNNLVESSLNLYLFEACTQWRTYGTNKVVNNIDKIIRTIFNVKSLTWIGYASEPNLYFTNARVCTKHGLGAVYGQYLKGLKSHSMGTDLKKYDIKGTTSNTPSGYCIFKTSVEEPSLRQLINRIFMKFNIKENVDINRILISVNSKRPISNLIHLEQALIVAGYKPKIIKYEELSIEEQIRETAKSHYLIGVYGSNITNSIFLQSNKSDVFAIILWPKYFKYLLSRTFCPIICGLMALKVVMIEYEYNHPNDIYNGKPPYILIPKISTIENNIPRINPSPLQLSKLYACRSDKIMDFMNLTTFINIPLLLKLIRLSTNSNNIMYINPQSS